jgi:hypothetical protein
MPSNKTKRRTSRAKRVKSRASRSRHSSRSELTKTREAEIVRVFIEMLNVVKLYHWKTHSYSLHKATDELYEKLNEHVDAFVEVLLGKNSERISMINTRIQLIDPESKKSFKYRIYEYRSFLVDLNRYLDPVKDSDLISIRDDILSDVNQFLYLMTFNK